MTTHFFQKFISINYYFIYFFFYYSPRASTVGRPGGLRAPQPSPYSAPAPPIQQQNKNSVLDKFKLFNNKDKNQERSKTSSGVSKRTSSSSGFSSARSEHSDSSTSLCDQSKTLVESPKSKALKSKLQSKPAKQSSPKSTRKEQTKAQSKIARTKGPTEKLTYSPPLDDVKSTSKIANIGTKITSDKRPNNLDTLKQSVPVQKFNSALIPPGHQKQTLQETKIVGKTEQKSIQRPKMELPAKIPDTKIHLQNIKVPVNGLNKDVISRVLPGSNGLIKHPTLGSPTHENSPNLDKTESMNQANTNLSEEKSVDAHRVQDYTVELSNKKRPLGDLEEEPKPRDNHISNENRSPSETTASSRQQESSTDNNVHIKEKESAAISQDVPASPQRHQQSNLNNISPFPGPNPPGQTGPGMSPGSSIPKPMALVKGTTKPPKEINVLTIPSAAKLKGDALHRKLDPNTVALVSPMPSISDLMSESSHSNSNSTGQSNSSDSSVIYRPSSESGSEIKTIPNRKIDTTFEQMEKVNQII